VDAFGHRSAHLYLLRYPAQIVDFTARNSEACGIATNYELVSRMIRQLRTTIHHHCRPAADWSLRRNKIPGRIQHSRLCVPLGPNTTGLPRPAVSRQEDPRPVVIRSPAPGISRHPTVAPSRTECPRAIHEGVPSNASKVRLPHHAVAGRVEEIAVVVEIAYAIGVRRVIAV
jgi:hypothetical protein